MNFEDKLRMATLLFEYKIKAAKEEYKKKNQNVLKDEMDKYVNKKLSREINFLLKFNLTEPSSIINS